MKERRGRENWSTSIRAANRLARLSVLRSRFAPVFQVSPWINSQVMMSVCRGKEGRLSFQMSLSPSCCRRRAKSACLHHDVAHVVWKKRVFVWIFQILTWHSLPSFVGATNCRIQVEFACVCYFFIVNAFVNVYYYFLDVQHIYGSYRDWTTRRSPCWSVCIRNTPRSLRCTSRRRIHTTIIIQQLDNSRTGFYL